MEYFIVIALAMVTIVSLYVLYVRLERERSENSIAKHRKPQLAESQFRVFNLAPERKEKEKVFTRFPREFRYFQVVTNDCKMEFCSLEELQEIFSTQNFTEFKHPVIKDNVLVSDLFIVVNGVILPRNFVAGCFIPKNHDRINLVTFWGDVFKIKVSERFGEEAVIGVEKTIKGLFNHDTAFSYSGYLVKSMLTKAIDDYRNGNVNYKALITGE